MASHYMLDLAAIPDGDFQRGREGRWIQRAVAAPSPSGWPRGSLGTPKALPFWPVQAERCLGFSLYFAANVVPGAVAMLLPLAVALRLWALLRFVGAPVGPGGRTAVAQPPRGVVCLVLRLRPIQQSHGRVPCTISPFHLTTVAPRHSVRPGHVYVADAARGVTPFVRHLYAIGM